MQEFNRESKLFYRNLNKEDQIPISMKYTPFEDWSEYHLSLAIEERKKCVEGITVNGVFIPPTLYYALNHTYMTVDTQNEFGVIQKKLMLPFLRDNEWIIHNAYHEAYKEKKGIPLGGSRQIGKTEFLALLTTHQLNFLENAEVLSVFASTEDKQSFVSKLDVHLKNNTFFLNVPNIDNDFTKKEIRFGYTEKDNTTKVFSKLFMLLSENGNNTEVAAGKANLNTSKVFYENKEGLIKDCKVGDRIYGQDGKLTTILGVYPQPLKQIYKITLADGRTTECCGEHLWQVKDIRTQELSVLDTNFLYNNYQRTHFSTKKNKYRVLNNYSIQKHECIEYPHKDVKIEPYYLGLFLGDGSANKVNEVCTTDGEILDYLTNYAKRLGGKISRKKISYLIRNLKYKHKNPLHDNFMFYGLKDNKHIPAEYLRNSKEVRLELLKGLMDTDGTCSKRGDCQIDLSDEKLATDVVKLIRSLGINCTVTTRETSYIYKGERVQCKLSYRIYMGYVNQYIFKLKRKKERQVLKNTSYNLSTSIIEIEKTKIDYSTCIKVDNSNSLFLVDDYIPTHNTPTMVILDEIGKAPFLKVYEAIKPAITGRFGLRCSPMLTFTSGDIEKVRDAKKIFLNPSIYDCKEFGEKKHGLFISGEYQFRFKRETTFGKYLNKDLGKELNDMLFLESDFEKANIELDEEEATSKKEDVSLYHQRKMYSPRVVDDMFIDGFNNPFSHLTEDLEALELYLTNNTSNIKEIELEEDRGTIKKIDTKKRQIVDYPSKNLSHAEKDAPICIIEEPVKANGKLYVAGLDPFNTIKTDESASLGSWYIIKKRMANYDDPYSERIVAWYNGRKSIKHFRDTFLHALMYYGGNSGNITALHEASDDTLTQWFDEQSLAYLLEDTFNLSREINPNSTNYNMKGLRATPKTQKYMLSKILDYLEEELPDGRLGLWRIPDVYLVKQLRNFDGSLSDTDAIVAFGHALMHFYKDDKFTKFSIINETKQEKKKPERKSVFKLRKSTKSILI